MTCDDAVTNYFGGTQGDIWHQHWEGPTPPGMTFDIGTLLAQIRTNATARTLIASSGGEDDIIPIDTSGSSFTPGATEDDEGLLIFKWKTNDSTGEVDPDAAYVVEADCEINGDRYTFFPAHPWIVKRQYAFEETP